MIASLFLIAAIQAAPPLEWSAECLRQISVAAGENVRFYDSEWLEQAKTKAGVLWNDSAAFVEAYNVADVAAERVSDALWVDEKAGLVPAGATEIDAEDRDRGIILLAQNYRALTARLGACELPSIELETMESRRAERQARLRNAE